jgi:hypothetical protein
MLSLQKCRELLGPSANLSDSELSALVNSLYVLAEAAVRLHARARRKHDGRPLGADELPDVDERAAIMEFDGQMSRADAERLARGSVTRDRRPSRVD